MNATMPEPGSAAARTIEVLRQLKGRWPASEFISALKEHDKRLYDAAYNNFARQAKELGIGRVQAALLMAGIRVPAGMNRHTSLTEDLDAMLGILTRLGRATEAEIRAVDSRLFNRVKKRAGEVVTEEVRAAVGSSVKAVAYLLWKRDRRFDPSVMFDHLPPGLYLDLPFLDGPQWYWVGCETPTGRKDHYLDLLRRMHAKGVHADAFLPDRFQKLSDGAARLVARINNDAHRVRQAWNWGDLVEEATGIPYDSDPKGRAGSARHEPRAHARQLDADLSGRVLTHKRLRSAEEVNCDGILSILIGRVFYERNHSHDVPLSVLVPKHQGRETVDVVVLGTRGRRVVVEVTNGRPDASYTERLEGKVRVLRHAGIPVVVFNGERSGLAYRDELEDTARAVLAEAGLEARCSISSGLRQLVGTPAAKRDYPPFMVARELVRREGITRIAQYRAQAAALGLPHNPMTYYRDQGYTDWSDFVGVLRTPGRQKGVKYSR